MYPRKLATPALLLLLGASILGGCRGYSGEKAREQREQWSNSLKDSIRVISEQRGRDSLQVVELQAKVEAEIGNFTMVNNPREVEPYYILSQYKGSYPLSATGIAARMMKNEQIELIAALSGRQFNAIRVEAAGESAESAVVPHDQALNYTANGLTTVAFTGAKADSVCDLISRNSGADISLQYLQNGGVQSSVKLTPAQINWIEKTWSLCSAHKQTMILEKKMLSDSRKIEILKITLAEKSQQPAKEE